MCIPDKPTQILNTNLLKFTITFVQGIKFFVFPYL